MPWFKVDDALAFHMKALAAGNPALGLWVRAGSWSMQQLSDGFVPASMVTALGGGHKDAKALTQAGLWHQVDGGFQFHDWAEYQPTRAEVEAERVATRERVKKHRAKQASNGDGNGVGNSVTNGVSTPAPSRPVPTPDSDKTYASQSLDNRAQDSTDSLIRKLAHQQGLDLDRIVEGAAQLGVMIDENAAFQFAKETIDKAKVYPDNPTAYVMGSLRQSPDECEKRLWEIA